MFFYLVLLAIIIVCAGIMALIFVRKFPQLTLIETESMPQVQNSARKKQIMDERVSRAAKKFVVGTLKFLSPLVTRLRDSFRRLVHHLTTLDRQFKNEQPLKPEQRQNRIDRLRKSAAKLVEQEKFGEAEKKLIEILTFDEMNEDVYRDLGELYLFTKKWDRARETYAFLIRVLVRRLCGQSVTESHGVPVPKRESFAETCVAGAPEHAEIAREFANFSHVCSASNDWGAAKVGLKTSLSFEPSNPRYLDLLVEACIMDGDKDRAIAALERLRVVNPENQKLRVLQERILALEPKRE
ncbi:hypothetical protein A2480_00710 [Candidatus Uhrbacteria bacterium RIFOXYC2_FULL_47_19]|uniref:Uncharacterized protein n=1 Tax=Candidatus Uhrbacteria bacterium RIFOXYC2_FULL_47_19 TaxID=1802424 RepID=A0A1F7WFP9_9BACT|nr:MAG: hypothetical protein A2480_00710 [Candidatus Uhrbacteria bacterium RIFOXYC2_FULL_47_19]HCC22351.1 hypothetical protein [Candidatus Uhrbacteria bacterium]